MAAGFFYDEIELLAVGGEGLIAKEGVEIFAGKTPGGEVAHDGVILRDRLATGTLVKFEVRENAGVDGSVRTGEAQPCGDGVDDVPVWDAELFLVAAEEVGDGVEDVFLVE